MSLVPVVTVESLPEPFRRYGLKFTFNSAAKLKEWTGCNVLAGDNPLGSVAPELTSDGKPKFIMDPWLLRALLAACLYHRDRGINPDDAGDLITRDNLAAITEGVMRAFAGYFGKTLEDLLKDADERPTLEAAGTPLASTNFGPSESTILGSPTTSFGA